VLSARGVELESELPFAGLHQLLRPALHLVERLPDLQARALNGALGLALRTGDDRFLISVACLSLLSELAERRPVLCLVDDVQWLDSPAADALLFVARRLDAERIVMLFAARDADGRSFTAPGLPTLELGGLDADAAETLLNRHAPVRIVPAVRDQIVERTGGNALALLELPSALSAGQLSGSEPLGEGLPLTQGVERVFLERVHRLPVPTQRLLLVAAADDTGILATVLRAGKTLGADGTALDPAETSGLVHVRGGRISLRHPLGRVPGGAIG
jgi:hypothetical protein